METNSRPQSSVMKQKAPSGWKAYSPKCLKTTPHCANKATAGSLKLSSPMWTPYGRTMKSSWEKRSCGTRRHGVILWAVKPASTPSCLCNHEPPLSFAPTLSPSHMAKDSPLPPLRHIVSVPAPHPATWLSQSKHVCLTCQDSAGTLIKCSELQLAIALADEHTLSAEARPSAGSVG